MAGGVLVPLHKRIAVNEPRRTLRLGRALNRILSRHRRRLKEAATPAKVLPVMHRNVKLAVPVLVMAIFPKPSLLPLFVLSRFAFVFDFVGSGCVGSSVSAEVG